MRANFGPAPAQIRGCQHLMKLAEDHDDRNVVIAYYARMATVQLAIKLMPGPKPPEIGKYLMTVMDWLEETKRECASIEGISNETVAQALIEEYMLKIYTFAYECDCGGDFNRNMVKAYYTSSLLCEVLKQFGTLSEDITLKGSISKRRATYIHNMLKQGIPPTPINVTVVHSEEEEAEHILTLEELNKRRIARGDDPLPIPDEPVDDDDDVPLPSAKFSPVPQAPDRSFDFDLPSVPEPLPRQKPPAATTPSPAPSTPSPAATTPGNSALLSSDSVADLEPSQSEKAIKYCKWASSALNYDDVKTAIMNLEKALYLCKFGKEKD